MASPRRVVVPLRPGTDGDPTHVPRPGSHTEMDPPTLYLEKIGDQWMKARGEARPGVKYVLEALPAGYTLWQRPRPKDPTHFDKYLYGHPAMRAFDSPNRFFPHFQHLMDNAGDNMGCPCTVCNGNSGLLPRSSSNSVKMRTSSTASSGTSSRPSSGHGPQIPPPAQDFKAPSASINPAPVAIPPSLSQHKGRPKLLGTGMDMSRVDEEGTPDVYRNLINKLRRYSSVDEPIEEPMSLDWRAEQETLPELLRKARHSPQWIPRIGDLVLYVRELAKDVHIVRHPIVGDYRLYDESTKLWLNHPAWEAGLVGQTPTESTSFEDICVNSEKKSNVAYTGIRVEPLPNVNDTDKSLSKRHKYIPVRHIRPFVLWKEFLHQIPNLHPTILNVQAVTSTLSLTGKYRFKGTWPDASIYCHGMYMGHEMIVVGDTVRLLPNASHGRTTCTDIMIIKSIRLKWTNLDQASENDWDEGRPYNSNVWVYGTAYTSNSARMNKEWLSSESSPSKAADDYGEWYPLHSPSKELAIPFSRIMGRLYEQDAMTLWLNTKSSDSPLLDTGREGLVEARKFSRSYDNRIAHKLDATWYWGDSRAQALDLHTVNGLDVAAHDQERDPKEWRKKIKIMEGMTANNIVSTAKVNGAPGLAGRNLRGFMAPALSTLPAPSHLARGTAKSSTGSSMTSLSSANESYATEIRRKRSQAILNDDDDDSEVNAEIRQATKIVEDRVPAQTKKARVTVVID